MNRVDEGFNKWFNKVFNFGLDESEPSKTCVTDGASTSEHQTIPLSHKRWVG